MATIKPTSKKAGSSDIKAKKTVSPATQKAKEEIARFNESWATLVGKQHDELDFLIGAENSLQQLQFLYGALKYIPDPDTVISKGGVQAYLEMLRDPTVRGALQLRIKAISSKQWVFRPNPHIDKADEEQHSNELRLLTKILSNVDGFTQDIEYLSKDCLFGITFLEPVWDKMGDMNVPVRFEPIDKQRIIFDNNGVMKLKTLMNPVWGTFFPQEGVMPKDGEEVQVPVPVGKLIYSRYDQMDSYNFTGSEFGRRMFGFGCGESIYRYWYIKFYALGLAAQIGERWANPIIDVKMPKGDKKTTDAYVSDMLTRIRYMKNSGVLFHTVDLSAPELYEVDFKELPVAAPLQHLIEMARMCDSQIRELLLGSNLTGSEGGSYAGQTVLNDLRVDILLSDINRIQDVINGQLIPYIRQFNPSYFDLSIPAPIFNFEYEKQKDNNFTLAKYRVLAENNLDVFSSEMYADFGVIKPDSVPDIITLVANGGGQNIENIDNELKKTVGDLETDEMKGQSVVNKSGS